MKSEACLDSEQGYDTLARFEPPTFSARWFLAQGSHTPKGSLSRPNGTVQLRLLEGQV